MEINNLKAKIEAMLFASGQKVEVKTLENILEVSSEDIIAVIESLKSDYMQENKGLQIIKVEDGYQMCTKEEYYLDVCALLENRAKPSLSNAALEVLSIIAYNPKITRSQIEDIRGVSSDSALNKLLEYNLVEIAGKLDAPGRPTVYSTTEEFLKMFGYSNLNELPELPRYKVDENEQIVIDEIFENSTNENTDLQETTNDQ